MENRQMLRDVTSWCRANMGRSHGDQSDWWVGRDAVMIEGLTAFDIDSALCDTVFIRNRKFAMLALLRWS